MYSPDVGKMAGERALQIQVRHSIKKYQNPMVSYTNWPWNRLPRFRAILQDTGEGKGKAREGSIGWGAGWQA